MACPFKCNCYNSQNCCGDCNQWNPLPTPLIFILTLLFAFWLSQRVVSNESQTEVPNLFNPTTESRR